MTIGQIFLLIIFFFPNFIYSLECGVGGICYGHGQHNIRAPFKLERKNCSDSCVSFKCFVDDGQIMEGAGCYEDFANTCKYTRTEIKENIDKYLQVREADVYFTSCNDEDGCATNGFEPWIINDTSNHNFGASFKENKDLLCKYDKNPMKYLETVNCSTLTNCESGKEFEWNDYKHPIYGKNKTCDACVKYTCTSDGKTVINGYGCFEDFEKSCYFINSDVKEKIKRNIKDSIYFDKNYIVFTCSDSDDCQIFSDSYHYYFKVNKLAESRLNVNESSVEACPIKTTTTPKPVTVATPQTTSNATKSKDQSDASDVFAPFAATANLNALQKITIFGLIFVYLW